MSYLRLILIGLFSIVCVNINAKHMEFMGIPITGTIAAFQTKPQSKGCTIAKGNNLLPFGIRGFKGVFARKIVIFMFGIIIAPRKYIKLELFQTVSNYQRLLTILLNQKYEGMALNSDMLYDSTKTEYKFDMVVIQPTIEVGAQALGPQKFT